MSIPDWFRKEHEGNLVSASREVKSNVLQTIGEISMKLKGGAGETEIQRLLKAEPHIIGGAYRLGHGTYAFSEVTFPPEYRADWLIASGHSGGFSWDLIELEDPQALPFMNDGHYSGCTRKGINQIKDWRNYIQNNLDYVTKSQAAHGLGLYDLRPRSKGMIVVGRNEVYGSEAAKDKYDEHRKRTMEDEFIEVVSYESFLKRCSFEYQKPPIG